MSKSPLLQLLTLLVLLLASTAAPAQNEPAPDQGPVALTHDFGAPDVEGSFRVGFSRYGAGIAWLQALDHYRSVEALRKEAHESGDYLLLIDNQVDYGLRLFTGDRTVFAKNPAEELWDVEVGDDEVRFTLADGNGLVLEKVFHHEPAARGFTVTVTLRNEGAAVGGNLPITVSGPALLNQQTSSLFGDVSVAIAATEGAAEVEYVKVASDGQPQDLPIDPVRLQFAGSTNRFFGAFLWPKDDETRAALTGFSAATVPPRRGVTPVDNSTLRVRYGMRLPVPAANSSTSVSLGLYIGPKSYREFEKLPDPERFEPILDVDLNPPCCGVTIPGGRQMAQLLLTLLGWFYDVLGNWGFAIVLLTILVRGCMFPINFRMQKSMRAFGKKMAKLKPKLDALKKQYKDDPAGERQAMAQFYRENKMIPPIGGCLPMFLTMPIYLGLFTALRTAYDLRHQPFVSWIDDLSRSDQLIADLGFWPDVFNLLPLLWIGLFVFMSLRQPLPTDPQQRQMQTIMRFMPILFGVMLYNYASGLLVYMVTSMLWSLVESAIVKKILGPIDPNAGAMTPTTI